MTGGGGGAGLAPCRPWSSRIPLTREESDSSSDPRSCSGWKSYRPSVLAFISLPSCFIFQLLLSLPLDPYTYTPVPFIPKFLDCVFRFSSLASWFYAVLSVDTAGTMEHLNLEIQAGPTYPEAPALGHFWEQERHLSCFHSNSSTWALRNLPTPL